MPDSHVTARAAPPRFSLVAAAYVVLTRTAPDGGSEVLLQLRQGTGYYDGWWACAAAGHLEAEESILECAAREVLEELGVAVSADALTAVTTMHRRGGSEPAEQRVDFFFACRAWSGEPHIAEPAKCAELRWFDVGNLPDAVVPHERYVLDRIAGGIAPIVLFGS